MNEASLVAICALLLACIARFSLGVNVTRLEQMDSFTNPNVSAVLHCRTNSRPSGFIDSCVKFNSRETKASCSSSSSNSCCETCKCEKSSPTYLVHLAKCVTLSELNSAVFGQGSNGCGSRLQTGSQNSGDDDRDDDDEKDACKQQNWSPPIIDFSKSKKPKIGFCRLSNTKQVTSCVVRMAQLFRTGQWRNVSNFKQNLFTNKKKHDIVFEWDAMAMSNYTGTILAVNVSCQQKKGGADFSSCFMFKTAGTQTVVEMQTTTAPTDGITTTPLMQSTTQKTTQTTGMPTTGPSHQTTSTEKSTKDTSQTITTESSITTTAQETSGKPIEVTGKPTKLRSPGNDRVSDQSGEKNGRRTTVIIVSVLCTVFLVVLSILTTVCVVRQRRKRKEVLSKRNHSVQTEEKATESSKPTELENNVYQSQGDVYQLLARGTNSTGADKWEPPQYQCLEKGATEKDTNSGPNVYSNPSMYQDLKNNGKGEQKEYSPAYHPLVKESQSMNAIENEYLVLVGEADEQEDSADLENPYYYQLEETE